MAKLKVRLARSLTVAVNASKLPSQQQIVMHVKLQGCDQDQTPFRPCRYWNTLKRVLLIYKIKGITERREEKIDVQFYIIF